MRAKRPNITRFYEFSYAPVLDLVDTDVILDPSTLKLFVPFGIDNALPRQLIKLAREVPVHRAILNSKTNYILGQGIQSSDPATDSFLKSPQQPQGTLPGHPQKALLRLPHLWQLLL